MWSRLQTTFLPFQLQPMKRDREDEFNPHGGYGSGGDYGSGPDRSYDHSDQSPTEKALVRDVKKLCVNDLSASDRSDNDN